MSTVILRAAVCLMRGLSSNAIIHVAAILPSTPCPRTQPPSLRPPQKKKKPNHPHQNRNLLFILASYASYSTFSSPSLPSSQNPPPPRLPPSAAPAAAGAHSYSRRDWRHPSRPSSPQHRHRHRLHHRKTRRAASWTPHARTKHCLTARAALEHVASAGDR